MEFHCWNSSSGEAPAPSGPARRIPQTLLILRQENKPQMIQNSLPFSELTCRGWSGATAALIYQFSGQFSPGLLSQAWPKTQNQNETLKKPQPWFKQIFYPRILEVFSHINEHTKKMQFPASPKPCPQEIGFTEVWIWLETFAFGQILLQVPDVTVS